jgi:hypothetical protein
MDLVLVLGGIVGFGVLWYVVCSVIKAMAGFNRPQHWQNRHVLVTCGLGGQARVVERFASTIVSGSCASMTDLLCN